MNEDVRALKDSLENLNIIKLFPNFTHHHLIAHTNIMGDKLLLNFGTKFQP